MKSTLGKLGMGLAGAVAFAGLMSAGLQRADAEISLPNNFVPDNPIIKLVGGSGAYASDYKWTYTLTVDVGSGVQSGDQLAFIDFAGYNAAAENALGGTNFLGVGATLGDWSLATTNDVLTDPSVPLADVMGLQDTNPSHAAYDNPNILDLVLTYNGSTGVGEASSGSVALGTFTFISSIGSYTRSGHLGYNISSASGSPVVYTSGHVNGNDTLDTPAVPLPAAFWPGLLTIGGMAVVGGLRMRRRTV